ncbi:MAG: O-antigen ligase family protein [Thermoleophilia bacterium]
MIENEQAAGYQGKAIAALVMLAVIAGLLVGQFGPTDAYVVLIVIGAVAAVVYTRFSSWRGLVILLISTQLSGLSVNSGQFTFRPDEVVFVYVMLIWMALFLQRRARLHFTLLDIPITGLVVMGFVSSYLYSNDTYYSYRSLLLQMVYMAMYYFTVNVLLDHRDRIDLAVKLMMGLAALHGLYAVVALAAYMGGLNLGGISYSHLSTLGIPSTAGFFPEANILGAFAAVMLAFFLTHLVTQGGTGIMKPRIVALGTLVLFMVALTSLTRSAWVGIIILVLVIPFYAKPKWNVINPRAVGLILAVFLGFGVFAFPAVNYVFSSASGRTNPLTDRLLNIFNTESSSVEGRSRIQAVALEEWKARPIVGHGVLSMRVGKLSTRGWLFSTMVQSLHDTGIIGGFFFLWIHFAPMVYAFWASTKTKDRLRKASLVAFGLGTIIIAISSQLSSFFWLGFPWVYLGILVAMSKDTFDRARDESAVMPAQGVV